MIVYCAIISPDSSLISTSDSASLLPELDPDIEPDLALPAGDPTDQTLFIK